MDTYQEASDVYKLLSDRNRLMILALLKEKDLCVCEIVELLQMSQPNVSQHMRKLKAGGLVSETKKGQWVFYSLRLDNKPSVAYALKQLPSVQNKVEKLELKERREPCEQS